jgi:hypothetical protein
MGAFSHHLYNLACMDPIFFSLSDWEHDSIKSIKEYVTNNNNYNHCIYSWHYCIDPLYQVLYKSTRKMRWLQPTQWELLTSGFEEGDRGEKDSKIEL